MLILVSAMGFAQNTIVNTFDDYTRLLSPEKNKGDYVHHLIKLH